MNNKNYFLLLILVFISGKVLSGVKSSDTALAKFESAYLHAPALKLNVDLLAVEAKRGVLAAQLDSIWHEQDISSEGGQRPGSHITDSQDMFPDDIDNVNSCTVSMSYQVLSMFSFTIFQRVITAYTDKNLKKFLKHAADFTELAEDLDQMAAMAGERNIPRNLHTRQLVVWKQWLEALHTSLLTKTEVDSQPFQRRFSKIKAPKPRRVSSPESDSSIALARLMFEKYKFHLVKDYFR
jgi:hypothetical protein